MDLEQNFYLTNVYRFLFMVLWYQMLYRGAAMHSCLCLCLVNAIFKCWKKINALRNTEHVECLLF